MYTSSQRIFVPMKWIIDAVTAVILAFFSDLCFFVFFLHVFHYASAHRTLFSSSLLGLPGSRRLNHVYKIHVFYVETSMVSSFGCTSLCGMSHFVKVIKTRNQILLKKKEEQKLAFPTWLQTKAHQEILEYSGTKYKLSISDRWWQSQVSSREEIDSDWFSNWLILSSINFEKFQFYYFQDSSCPLLNDLYKSGKIRLTMTRIYTWVFHSNSSFMDCSNWMALKIFSSKIQWTISLISKCVVCFNLISIRKITLLYSLHDSFERLIHNFFLIRFAASSNW